MPDTAHSPRAKKSLGQHFLRSAAICERIAALLQPSPADRILEIGPGPGALTRALETLPHASLVLIEKDRHWASLHRAGLHTQSVLMDALHIAWQRLDFPCKIVGNLPYNIASALIWDCVSQAVGLTRAVFMVQKEVGERLTACSGKKAYGALSVWVQNFAKPHFEFIVKRSAFTPPPEVDSAVVSFEPLPQCEQPEHPKALSQLLRICFQQRRKQLGGIFRRADLPATALEALDICPSRRPESLSPAEFQQLSLFLRACPPPG